MEVDGSGRMHGKRVDSNAIVSAYSKDNAITKLLREAVDSEKNSNGGIYYWQKNKAVQLLSGRGVQFPGGLNITDGFVRSISDPLSNVKPKFKNVTQTQQFKRWFGDWRNHPETASKVVNEDGTPKVMYHGSPSEFT